MVRTHRVSIFMISALLVYSISFSLVHKLTHLPLVAQQNHQHEYHSIHFDRHPASALSLSSNDKNKPHFKYCALCSILAMHAIIPVQFNLPAQVFVAFLGVSQRLSATIFVTRRVKHARAPPEYIFHSVS